MTTKTRYFVIVSLLVMGVGLGTGMVAYYGGFPAGAFAGRGGPAELDYVPRDATVLAYADVRDVMTSELRQKLHSAAPIQENGRRELEEQTGINIETDIDHVVACLYPQQDSSVPGAGMALLRGRFDEGRIEGLTRDHGGQVEEYRTKRLILLPGTHGMRESFAVAFVEPGLVALGTERVVRTVIDLHQTGNKPNAGIESITGNEELMNQVRALETGNAWAVGRFDALRSQAHLPENVASQIPAITWFSISTHVNGGIRGVVRAETRDDDAANNLRDVVRGFLALGKLQAGGRPEIQSLMQSLELGGSGKTVALSFDVPLQVFDLISALHEKDPASRRAH
jgi:hypothetical protein